MTIRNELLSQVLIAYGGTPKLNENRNSLLESILIQIGGIATNPNIRNALLRDIVLQLGGTITNPNIRNALLRDIVLASGGAITDPNSRNQLILDWLNSISAPVCRLVADLNGLSQYITIPKITFTTGDTLEIWVVSPGSPVLINNYVSDSDNGTLNDRLYIIVSASSGAVNFNSSRYSLSIDDVPAVDGVTIFPIDGQPHKLSVTIIQQVSIAILGARYTISDYYSSIIYDVKVNDGSVYNYPINDGFDANPTIANTADPSGTTDGTAINFTEATWVEVCEEPAESAFVDSELWEDSEQWID